MDAVSNFHSVVWECTYGTGRTSEAHSYKEGLLQGRWLSLLGGWVTSARYTCYAVTEERREGYSHTKAFASLSHTLGFCSHYISWALSAQSFVHAPESTK